MTGEEFLKRLKDLGYEVHRAEAQYRSVFRSLTGTTVDPSKDVVKGGSNGSKFDAIAIAAEKWDGAKAAFNEASKRFMELIEGLPQQQKDDLTLRYIERLNPGKAARRLRISREWERAIHLKARTAFNEAYEKRGL